LHGGAWMTGYAWWNGFMAPGVHMAGAVLVAPSYRLAPASRFPIQLADTVSAIRWVYDNAGELGIDRNRLVLGGHSAGGHLAALAALHPTALAKAGVPRSVIKHVFAVSTPFNVHYPDAAPGSGEERVAKYLLQDPADAVMASPITYASTDAPPFHITYGARDYDRISRNSAIMVDALRKLGAPVTSVVLPDKDHFDTHLALGDPRDPWFNALKHALNA
jgi:arylformamidase